MNLLKQTQQIAVALVKGIIVLHSILDAQNTKAGHEEFALFPLSGRHLQTVQPFIVISPLR